MIVRMVFQIRDRTDFTKIENAEVESAAESATSVVAWVCGIIPALAREDRRLANLERHRQKVIDELG